MACVLLLFQVVVFPLCSLTRKPHLFWVHGAWEIRKSPINSWISPIKNGQLIRKYGNSLYKWSFRSLGTSTRSNRGGVFSKMFDDTVWWVPCLDVWLGLTRPSIWPCSAFAKWIAISNRKTHLWDTSYSDTETAKVAQLETLRLPLSPFLAVFLSPSSRLHCCPQPCEDVYASAMEVNFWGSSTCSSASWDATQKQWLVTWCCEATCQLAVRLGYNCLQQNKQ